MSHFLKISVDAKYAEKLERKKRVLADRAKRIFDPVLSQQAYDTAEIQKQVAERKAAEGAEKMRDLTFDRATHMLDAAHLILQQKEREAIRIRAKELEDYRVLYQRKERSATFQLNDPDAWKKEQPVGGANGDYSTYGPSSILTFESDKIRQPEDLKNGIHRQRDDLARQMEERQEMRDFQRHLDNVSHAENAAQEAKMNELELASQELQKAMKMANREYNEALSVYQEESKRHLAELEADDEKSHINNTMNSDLLNERPTNPRDRKGISPDEEGKIYECWNKQKQDIHNVRHQEREEQCTWNNYFRAVGNQYNSQMKELREERVTMRKHVDNINKTQAVKSQERQTTSRVVFCPTDQFFDQFQRDAR